MKNVETIQINVTEELKKVATKKGGDLEGISHTYFLERWLYRLSISPYQEKFLLKGDYLLASLTNGIIPAPSTISLSAKQMTQHRLELQRVFKEISAIQVPEDGVTFLGNELKIVIEQDQVNIEIPVKIGQMHSYIEINVSYREHQILKPKDTAFPTLLGTDSPTLLGKTAEVVIAEKFEAMIRLVDEEGRMKDFYDVYVLLNNQTIEGRVLQEAVWGIFDRHGTRLERELPILSEKFYLDAQRNEQWLAFSDQQDLAFEAVIKRIQKALTPIYNAIVNEDEFFGNWDCKLQDWK